MRDYNHPANRKAHFGTSGIGKTTDFVKRLRKEKSGWIFIFDHKREFSQKLGGLPVCCTLEQLCVATQKGGTICFDHQVLYPGDRTAGAMFFAEFVYSVAGHLRGRKILVIDELQEVAGPDDQPFELIKCLDDGRSLKIDFLGIAQSPNGIHNKIRNQLTEMFVFRQSDENAIKHLKQNGFDENEVRGLQPGQWLWKNLNTGNFANGGKAFRLDASGTPDGGKLVARENPQTGSVNHGDLYAPSSQALVKRTV